MTNRIETKILRYLGFQPVPEEDYGSLWQAGEEQWRKGLAFADTAGLTLFLRANLRQREDSQKLTGPVQQGLEQRFQDNLLRTQAISREFIEFNRLLQARNIRYLNLKGQLLYPDFVDQCENRLQFDHDFLIHAEDLERAHDLFLNLGYSPLPSSPKLAVSHLPTLVKRTGWKWQGNLFDPDIPRAVELHFELWDSKFDKIPIRTLESAWRNSQSISFLHSLSVPVLSREHTLLYSVLHCFRHLLRNDLRLSHLFEIGYFLHNHRGSNFWQGFLESTRSCPKGCGAAATVFELACRIFRVQPAAIVTQFVSEHLSPAASVWIESYGLKESIHCYRRSKSSVFLHLDFVDGLVQKGAVVSRKLIPRHLPVSSFGVQTPIEKQDRCFRAFKLLHDSVERVQRFFFHSMTLAVFLFQFPLWMVKLHLRKSNRLVSDAARHESRAITD